MINEIFSFSFGQRKESFTSIHGSSSLLLSFCGFSSLFFLYCDSVCHFYHKCDITPSCKQCSLQLLLSLPISNDAEMATKLSDASLLIKYNKKSHIKGRAPAFILSAFFFRIRIFFLRHAFYNTSCVVPCIFAALVGTGVWYLQSLSCVCLPNDDYSSLTCVCPIPFLSTYRCTPTQLL